MNRNKRIYFSAGHFIPTMELFNFNLLRTELATLNSVLE